MKPYILTTIISFLLGCIFMFAYIWSMSHGPKMEIFRTLVMIMVILFILSMVALFLKFIFRKGVKKFNL